MPQTFYVYQLSLNIVIPSATKTFASCANLQNKSLLFTDCKYLIYSFPVKGINKSESPLPTPIPLGGIWQMVIKRLKTFRNFKANWVSFLHYTDSDLCNYFRALVILSKRLFLEEWVSSKNWVSMWHFYWLFGSDWHFLI